MNHNVAIKRDRGRESGKKRRTIGGREATGKDISQPSAGL